MKLNTKVVEINWDDNSGVWNMYVVITGFSETHNDTDIVPSKTQPPRRSGMIGRMCVLMGQVF